MLRVRNIRFGRVLLGLFVVAFLYALLPSLLPIPMPSTKPSTKVFAMANQRISALTENADHVVRVFQGPPGLTGVVIENQAHHRGVVWMLSEGQHPILVGALVTRHGNNLTAAANVRYGNYDAGRLIAQAVPTVSRPSDRAPISAPRAAPAVPSNKGSSPASNKAHAATGNKVLERALTYLSTDSGAIRWPGFPSGDKPLYVFIDPNCIFCNHLFHYVSQHLPMFRHAGVEPVIVPVAFLKSSSAAKAAAIEMGGFKAYRLDEDHFNAGLEEGGIKPAKGPRSVPALKQVRKQTQTMFEIGKANHTGVGTPLLLWRAGDRAPYFVIGSPSPSAFKVVLGSFRPGWTSSHSHAASAAKK